MSLTSDQPRLNLDQVKHVAKLASLPLSADEEKLYGEQLSQILDYIHQLNKVDTASIDPTFNVTGLSDVLAEDKTDSGLSQDEALRNAPTKDDGLFMTKGVFEEE